MLHEWLAPASVPEFVRGYLGRKPHARPGAAARAVPWFDWTVLGRLLEWRLLVALGSLPAAARRLSQVFEGRVFDTVRKSVLAFV
jgi:hypothetical protein